MQNDSTLQSFLSHTRLAATHRPWPRHLLDEPGWRAMIEQLAVTEWTLLGLWAEGAEVHAALRDEEDGFIAVVSQQCPDRRFHSLSEVRPGAIRLERAAADLFGLTPVGLTDPRPWLDHGRWAQAAPLAIGRRNSRPKTTDYTFLPVEGEGLHRILVGPVHAGVIEPGHFRFACAGETVVRLEERLGYTHKGIEAAMAGKPVAEAARLAARISGDSTVAYSLAFARAVEAATGSEAPPRADWMRGLLAELERLANHLQDIGAIANDAAFAYLLARCMVLREQVLAFNQKYFGHRLLMDRIIPGGVTVDLTREAMAALKKLVAELRRRFDVMVDLYDDLPSLQDRTVGTGIVDAALAHRFGAGGFVGRAASRGVDARKVPGYAPYPDLDFEIPVHPEGDVNARVWVRIEEVRASLSLIEQIVEGMPGGPLARPIPTRGGEGMALVEGFRGEILLWLRLSEIGKVVRCHPRDPSWFQWPLLEAAIEGNIIADFPLCNKSFNCSYSGVDL